MSEEKSGLKKDIDISQFTVRINKNIDDVVVDYANKYGMSRNSLVAFIIGEWVENKKKQDRQEEMQFNKFIEFISNPDVIKNNSSL